MAGTSHLWGFWVGTRIPGMAVPAIPRAIEDGGPREGGGHPSTIGNHKQGLQGWQFQP